MGEESREEGKVNFYLGTPYSLSINIHCLTFPLSADITTLLLMTIISWRREQSLFSFTSWGSRKVGIKITFFWIWQVFVLLVTPKFNLVRGEQGEPEYSKPCIYSTKCVFYVCFQVFLMSELMTEQENFLSPLNIQTPPSSPLQPIVPREVSV